MNTNTEDLYTNAVAKTVASTVGVRTIGVPSGQPYWCMPMMGVGSGIVLDGDGHILTNQHVVRQARRTAVTLPDGTVTEGIAIGGDEDTDIAVVKVDVKGLVPAEFGDSNALKLGQPILAVGNPLGMDGGPTVTSGVISSLRRSLHLAGNGLDVIQTDAAINPGNSGGPIINLQGQVIAIATARAAHAEGIGFAVPSNLAKKVASEILANGRVMRPWLGIVGYELNRHIAYHYGIPAARGVFVSELAENGPAESSGVREGDVITGMAGNRIVAMEDLTGTLRTNQVKDTIELEVERYGQTKRLQVTLGARPQ
jgi:serine protease Do